MTGKLLPVKEPSTEPQTMRLPGRPLSTESRLCSKTAYPVFSETVLIDADTNKAEGEALDISHGLPFGKPMKIYAGGYDDITDAAIIIVTAGQTKNREKPDLI